MVFLFLAVGAVFMGLPLVFSISLSLKPLDELWLFPPTLWVRNPTFKNFTDLFAIMSNSLVPFSKYIFNTTLITASGTLFHVVFASMCAYALAKFKFKGKEIIFSIIVLSLMFSGAVTGIPNFMVMRYLGLIDTYFAIIVPAIGSSLGLYLMKQFMEQIPDTYLEAARAEGAHEWRIFRLIVMPMAKPAWLTLIVFSVQGLWNVNSSVFIYREELKPLAYALGQIASAGIARAGVGAAVIVVMMSVPIITFIITQSGIIETMSSSGLKE
jgi:ABC-type glycerol-3-phosphate transport system permease component